MGSGRRRMLAAAVGAALLTMGVGVAAALVHGQTLHLAPQAPRIQGTDAPTDPRVGVPTTDTPCLVPVGFALVAAPVVCPTLALPSSSRTPSPRPSTPQPMPTPSRTPLPPDVAPPPLRVVPVKDAGTLASALAGARPGDEIRMANGAYNGRFVLRASGTAAAPITVTGSRQAVVNGGGTSNGRVFELHGSYVRLKGFTVTNGQKGVMAHGVRHVVIDGLLVHTIGDEAIHLRDGSSDNVIRNCEVRDTGKREPGFGEAIYLGQAVSNWTGGPDRSDRNKVLNNKLGPNIAAEHIDIKEGTTGGEVRGNVFDGRGQTGANSGESWINAKGNDYLIADNTGQVAYKSGYKTRELADGWGCGNVFRRNTGSILPTIGSAGWAFDIHDVCLGNENVVCDDNTVHAPTSKLSNVSTRRCPTS